jgi:hypothetical protein
VSAVFGNHRQRGTLRFLSYHAFYQERRPGFVIYAGSLKDGERFLGLHDGQVDFGAATMFADEKAEWTSLTTADPVASTSSCQPISLTSTSWRRAPYPRGCAVAQRGLACLMI